MAHSPEDNPLPDEIATRGYAGDIDPARAWRLLLDEDDAVLVDVRTSAEWNFVGVPDLSSVGKQPVKVEWQSLPSMARNADFEQQVKVALAPLHVGPDSAIVLICRSGARSRDAAISLTKKGFKRCYNLAGGFEGDLGPDRHRASCNGWKFSGLPWLQS